MWNLIAKDTFRTWEVIALRYTRTKYMFISIIRVSLKVTKYMLLGT